MVVIPVSRVAIGLLLALTLLQREAQSCPFCSAAAPPFRQELAVMDAVAIATPAENVPQRDPDTSEVRMKIVRVLRGGDLIRVGQEVVAPHYGDLSAGKRFLISGVDPPNLLWSSLPVSKRAEDYLTKVLKLGDDPVEQLKFFYGHLDDAEQMLERDAYDEFALAPYPVIKKLKPHLNREQLIEWISEPEVATSRKRLYLTLLGVCGGEQDLPALEAMLRSSQKSTRAGLDALVGCYLTLAGEKGLPLVNEQLLANKKSPYADTYAAIMAIRFHGTEGDVIPRSALVESLHLVLDREDLADLVIPDLARWGDWSQIDRLFQMFIDADEDNNWVRVPVINYLRACPLDKAKEAIKKLEEIDPESVRRANSFFAIPVPAREAPPTSSQVLPESELLFATATVRPGEPTASVAAIPTASGRPSVTSNPWRMGYVLLLAMASVMIGHFLLLAGGAHPAGE